MAEMKLYLFGPPRLERNGQPHDIPLRKAFALLIYLAVTRQAHSRDALATLLWPEKEQQAARANLRRILYDLGQLTGEQFVEAGPETVSIAADVTIWLDIEEFQKIVAESLPSPPLSSTVDEARLLPLVDAVNLYTGDFLAGFTLPDCPEFDDWQFFLREELRRTLADVLQQLVRGYEALGKVDEALRYARRWLQLDPLEESVHRQLMQLYAQAGQAAAAIRQYEECVRILDAEFGVSPEEETTALYEAIRTRRYPVQEHQDEPLPASPAAAPRRQDALEMETERGNRPIVTRSLPHNLSAQPTPFVGRVHELNAVLRSLRTPACRLLTIVGPGGIGKTRLARQAAQRIVDEAYQSGEMLAPSIDGGIAETALQAFSDGVFFVPLQPVDAVSGLIYAIAEATGFHFYSDIPPHQQLLNFLHGKRMLLILDSMEHLPDGATLVSELLTKTPGLKLLVTSQRALNLQEEWFHPLAGMTLPHPQDQATHPALEDNGTASNTLVDAVQLFVQCAYRARVNFDLDEEREQVERICRLVDGMPLALELAAVWLKVLSCKQIADEIERSLDFLTARHQNIPVRHRSMHAVLEQSWQLLGEAEQAVLKRLSIFRGGFTQEAAREVADASLLTLATLVDRALIWVTPSGRYQMHELLRQFAYKQLAADPNAERATKARQSAYYLRFLSTRSGQLISKRRRVVLNEVGQEIENVRQSWDWAVQQRDLAILNQAVEPLYNFYQIQSRYQEGKEIFTQAWDSLKQSSEIDEDPRTAMVAVHILARCGAFHYFLCEYEVAVQYMQECLARAQTLGQQEEVALALNFLGQLAVWQGEQAQARTYLLQSLAISQEIGDKSGAANTLEKLANLTHATFGEYAESKQLAAQSLALSRELERPDWIAYALDTLGFITFCLGEYEEAAAYYQESLALFEAIEDQYGIAMALGGMGLVLWAMEDGRQDDATAYLQKSLLICRTIGHQGQIVGRFAGLARIANDLGHYDQAQQIAYEGLPVARELGSPVYLSHLLYCLGESACGMGDLHTARTYLLEALQVTSKTRLLAYLSIALFHYAILLIKESEGDLSGAAQKQAKALELLTLVQHHPATWHVYKRRARGRYAALEAQLPETLAAAAKARGANHTLEKIVGEIVEQLDTAEEEVVG